MILLINHVNRKNHINHGSDNKRSLTYWFTRKICIFAL